MAIDKKYARQLEKFGIESVLVIEENQDKKQRLQYRETNLSVVKNLMNTMEGRQWLFSKLDMCRVFCTPFIATDPHGTSFFSGVQAVGHNLLDDIMRAVPENFAVMLNEAAARDVMGKENE